MDVHSFIDTLFARAKEAGFEACEVYYTAASEFETDVLRGEILRYSVSDTLGLGFRGLIGGKMGYASTQILDGDAIDQLVDGAKTNAALIENPDKQFLYPGDADYPTVDTFNPALETIPSPEKIEMARELEKKALAADPRITQVDGLNPKSAPSAATPVILAPDAAISLLRTFTGVFSADSAQKGMSLLKDREGELVASECVTLLDNPLLAGSLASRPFDGEGVRAREKKIIDSGRLTTLMHNLKTARKQGVESTGNATRSYNSALGIAPSNFYFIPGECSQQALMEKMENGLLITELQGLHAGANPISGDFSLSAKGFAVRGGKRAEAVAQITAAGNFYALLREIQSVGSDLKLGFPGLCRFGSPSLLVRELAIAGAE